MEVTLSAEVSRLIACQQALKNKIEKQIVLSIIVTIVVALSSKLSLGLLFVTLVIIMGMLIFLTVTMQDIILNLQRNWFTICYQHLHSQDSQSQERQEPLGQ